MVIGMLRVQLHIGGAIGMSDRHRVVKRAIDRIRNQYNASISDVGDIDHPQVATLAVAIVTRSDSECDHNLTKIENALADILIGHALVSPGEREVVHYNAETPMAHDDYTPMAKGAFPEPPRGRLPKRRR
jgi:uncharacterized protein YlxP (DUF503 family)